LEKDIFLKALKTILDSKTDSGIMQLTQEQLDEIITSKIEIEQGLFIENNVLEKEVRQWLNRACELNGVK